MIPVPPSLARVPALERRAAVGALAMSVVLTTVKFWAYFLTNSAAVFSDAVESIVNVMASSFALYALALSHEPADRSHPYGHGKVEFLSASVEGGMIFVAGAVVLWRGVEALVQGSDVELSRAGGLGVWLLAATGAVNGLVGYVLLRIGKGRNSLALEADGRHLISDLVTTAGALASLGVVYLTGQTWLDAAAAVLIGLYLFWTAYGLLRQSTAGLMDEQDEGDDELINRLLESHVRGESEPKICSFHKVRHRHTGRLHWVDFHLRVPGSMSVFDGHRVACRIEEEIERALGEADATAHVEPCGKSGCPSCGAGAA